MTTVVLVIAGIILLLIFAVGAFLYNAFGAPGIIIPLIILVLIGYFINMIGVENILVILGVLAAIKVIRKIVTAIHEARVRRRLRRWRTTPYYSRTEKNSMCTSPSHYEFIPAPIEEEKPVTVSARGCKENNRSERTPSLKTNNCPNCGALMIKGVCPYCNTRLTDI